MLPRISDAVSSSDAVDRSREIYGDAGCPKVNLLYPSVNLLPFRTDNPPPMAQQPHQKGICDVCRLPVLDNQPRTKNQWGAYVHAQCVAGADDERVVDAGVSPPIAPKPELKEVKGICDVCRMPVFADQARTKNQRGDYVHAQCVAGADDERVDVAGVSPPMAPELKDVKGICDVCRMPVFVDQARTKNQRGDYVHAKCTTGAGVSTKPATATAQLGHPGHPG